MMARAPNGPGDRGTGRDPGARGVLIGFVILLLAFSIPLYHLLRFALSSELYSHIVLIPFISGYLVWTKRKALPAASRPMRTLAAGLFVLAAAVLVWRASLSGSAVLPEDSLAFFTSSFLLCFAGLCLWFLGRETIRSLQFPLGFLIFMVPLPVAVQTTMETFLQHGSAAAAYGFFRLSGMPVFQHNLVFELPGFSLEVAPQCSGIHSSLALFITSVLAAHLFLRSPWKQVTLAAVVIPLALLRNGFRVFVIGTLCVRVGPEMIDSYIHRQGGPIFFALSLIPLLLLLWWLVRSDRPKPLPSTNGGARYP